MNKFTHIKVFLLVLLIPLTVQAEQYSPQLTPGFLATAQEVSPRTGMNNSVSALNGIPAEVRNEIAALLDNTRVTIETMESWQFYGIGLGIVSGILVADAFGGRLAVVDARAIGL